MPLSAETPAPVITKMRIPMWWGKPRCPESFRESAQRADPTELLPADLAAFVLVFQPGHERLEVIHHRARGDVFACGFFQDFAPIFRAAFFKDVIQPPADFFVVRVIT